MTDMQQQNQRKKKKKSLTFADENDNVYCQIPNRDEIEVKQDVWFSDEELSKTLTECIQTVAAMQGGIPLGEDESETYTSRGLEYMTADGFEISNSRRETVQMVLQEQARLLQENGSVDPELLAASIESVSRHRMRIATLTGLKDERAAKSIFRGTDDAKKSAWGTTSDHNAATEEVKKKIAARRKFRDSSNRRPGADGTRASMRAMSDHSVGSTRRSRASHRVRITSQKPQRAASLDVL